MSDREFRKALIELDSSGEEYTPIKFTRRSRVVHATSLREPSETACEKPIKKGGIVVARRLTCRACKLAVGLDARTRRA